MALVFKEDDDKQVMDLTVDGDSEAVEVHATLKLVATADLIASSAERRHVPVRTAGGQAVSTASTTVAGKGDALHALPRLSEQSQETSHEPAQVVPYA